jgi:tetratricopeptide (TPR) repeat protein
MPDDDSDSQGLPSRPWWTAALIFALVLVCYWPALRGGMLWDDDGHVTKPELRSLAGLGRIWFNIHATQQYYPLLHSAFWVEHALWGDQTLGYHLVNVAEHALAAFLLIVVLRRLRVPGAVLAGVIFAVHPVCVESVAWISEQKNTFSLVLYLLAALAYLDFDRDPELPSARRSYRVASLLFVMALLTKTVTATLPAALLVIFWWQRGKLSWRRDVGPLAPWFAVAIASGLFTAWIERTVIGAEGAAFGLGLWQRCLLAGRVVWFYAGKLLWPADLTFVYPRWDPSASTAAWTVCLLAAVAMTGILWVLRRRSRAPLAAWLFYVGSLFPALGFFNVYPFIFSFVADHFQYLASMGIIAGAAAGATLLFRRARPAGRAAGLGIASGVVAVLCLLSNAQSQTYADEPTLYKATLDRNPGCWMAHNNLGLWYENHGDPGKAMFHYKEALRLRKDYPQAHINLGGLYENRGDLEAAAGEYRAALAIWKDYVVAHNNLGSVLGKMPGRQEEAIAEFRKALSLNPEFATAHDNLGEALARIPGHMNEAVAQYEEALRILPGFADAHADLGNAYSDMPDRMGDAIAEYQEALRLNPNNAGVRSNLGLALNSQGRPQEAIDQFGEALRLMPGFVDVRLNMALALLNIPGRQNEAAVQLELYLQARPGNQGARHLLEEIRAGSP